MTKPILNKDVKKRFDEKFWDGSKSSGIRTHGDIYNSHDGSSRRANTKELKQHLAEELAREREKIPDLDKSELDWLHKEFVADMKGRKVFQKIRRQTLDQAIKTIK